MKVQTLCLLLPLWLSSCQPQDFGAGPTTNRGPNFLEREKANRILEEFQVKHHLPGISMAISYKNRLVYSASCGYADFENRIPLTPGFRMRIASVSKPITATAVMKLVETGRLGLDDQVFGDDSILGNEYGRPRYKNLPARITIRNLLSHTAGGWGNSDNDPMFALQTISLDGKNLIQRVLRDFPLTHPPGRRHEYSNFGYYLLGRVIEKVSDKSYGQFVRDEILNPLGIEDMVIGDTRTAMNEVVYYKSDFTDPNFCSPTHMDSHGGWIATPIDLLRFLSGINKLENSLGLLQDKTISLMTVPAIPGSNYGLGFEVNRLDNWWHGGSLPGTSSELARASDGFCWAILVNYRPAPGRDTGYYSELDALFWRIKSAIAHWPAGDPL